MIISRIFAHFCKELSRAAPWQQVPLPIKKTTPSSLGRFLKEDIHTALQEIHRMIRIIHLILGLLRCGIFKVFVQVTLGDGGCIAGQFFQPPDDELVSYPVVMRALKPMPNCPVSSAPYQKNILSF